jgi:hypothetical protein
VHAVGDVLVLDFVVDSDTTADNVTVALRRQIREHRRSGRTEGHRPGQRRPVQSLRLCAQIQVIDVGTMGRSEDLVPDDLRFERLGIVKSRSRHDTGVVGAEERLDPRHRETADDYDHDNQQRQPCVAEYLRYLHLVHDVYFLQIVQVESLVNLNYPAKMLVTRAAARSTYGMGVSSASFGSPPDQLSRPERMAVIANAAISAGISSSGPIA